MSVRSLGEFEHHVLLAMLRLGDGASAPAILDEIEARTGRPRSRGSIYITLDRLEEKGLAASRYADPHPDRGGRSRRYVRVTPAGVEALQETRRALLGLWHGLEDLLEGT